MGLPSVAYISPINYQLAEKLLGSGATEHIAAMPSSSPMPSAVRRGERDGGQRCLRVSGHRVQRSAAHHRTRTPRLGASIGDAVRPYLKGGQMHAVDA